MTLEEKVTNEEIISYLELIINNYLDRYGAAAKEHQEFMKAVKEYKQLMLGEE